jgi:hypothetical protein
MSWSKVLDDENLTKRNLNLHWRKYKEWSIKQDTLKELFDDVI